MNTESQNKYKLLKQFMHNELGITKDDIREWIREAVKEEAKQLVQQTGFTAQGEIRKVISDNSLYGKNFNSDIKRAVAEVLAEQFTIEKKI